MLRLRGDYLAIVTLGFAEVVRLIASNEIWLTNGADGISGVPGPWRGALTPLQFNALAAVLVWPPPRSPGRGPSGCGAARWVARCAPFATTRPPPRSRASRCGGSRPRPSRWGPALSGSLARSMRMDELRGAESFRPLVTIYIFLALTAGGTGNTGGAVLGALLVVVVLEGSRFVEP